jgi:prolyl-tRNA editing enzyme YbaK/EbsC (Cys-tRNA(Pro) deacylase)
VTTPERAVELLAENAVLTLESVRRDVISARQHLLRFPVLHWFHPPSGQSVLALVEGATLLWVAARLGFSEKAHGAVQRHAQALEVALRRLIDGRPAARRGSGRRRRAGAGAELVAQARAAMRGVDAQGADDEPPAEAIDDLARAHSVIRRYAQCTAPATASDVRRGRRRPCCGQGGAPPPLPHSVPVRSRTLAQRRTAEGRRRRAGIEPERMLKGTLLAGWRLSDGGSRLVCWLWLPVSGLLDLKALAVAAGGKRGVMAEPAAAERSTGYVVGGSARSAAHRLLTVVDETAESCSTPSTSAQPPRPVVGAGAGGAGAADRCRRRGHRPMIAR